MIAAAPSGNPVHIQCQKDTLLADKDSSLYHRTPKLARPQHLQERLAILENHE